MKLIFSVLAVSLILGSAFADNEEAAVRATIETFYDNFNEGFTRPADYATEDWSHINPTGGRIQGREAVLKRLRDIHQSFLKGAKETIESMDVRFASEEVAVGTVIAISSPFVAPDWTRHDVQHGIRTCVVVKRGDRWLIMQDHSTTVTAAPDSRGRGLKL